MDSSFASKHYYALGLGGKNRREAESAERWSQGSKIPQKEPRRVESLKVGSGGQLALTSEKDVHQAAFEWVKVSNVGRPMTRSK